MVKPLVLYSTNTWLAYRIAQAYYHEKHYVWCASCFTSNNVPFYDVTLPPSSTPGEIYFNLNEDIIRGDRHSAKIEMNKTGILKGANSKKNEGVINDNQRLEIYSIVKKAETLDFRPLIYVIPYQKVASMVKNVPIEDRAHPLSVEFKIHSLDRKQFDIIEFYKR